MAEGKDSPQPDSGDQIVTAVELASRAAVIEAGYRDSRPCRLCELDTATRETVEALITSAVPAGTIAKMASTLVRAVDPEARAVNTATVKRHIREHLPMAMYMRREIVERHAERAGIDVENSERSLLTPAAYAEQMMGHAARAMEAAPDQVTPMEGLAAAKTLAEMEAKAGVDGAEALAQLDRIIRAVRAVCTVDQMDRIVAIVEESESGGQAA